MARGKMHIGMSIRGLGYHPAAWRHPDVPADGTLRFEHYARSAKAAERGKCDLIFFADGIAIRELDVPKGSLVRMGYELVEMEPMTLLPALAVVTKHIGLVTTASTTYNEPFNLARKFATLDWISNGRAGWNVVTSWSEAEAKNFGREEQLDYDTRYARAGEFVDVVRGLWDSWEDDAFVYDKERAEFYDDAQAAYARSHGSVLQGTRAAGHGPPAARASDHRAGRCVGAGPRTRRYDSRYRLRDPRHQGHRAGVLRRHQGPHGEVWPRAK